VGSLLLSGAHDGAYAVALAYDDGNLRVQTIEFVVPPAGSIVVTLGQGASFDVVESGVHNVPGNRRLKTAEDGPSVNFPVTFQAG
jgi:hypothetical protein